MHHQPTGRPSTSCSCSSGLRGGRARDDGRCRRHGDPAAARPPGVTPLPEPLRRYFRPGVNWAGRTIYGIPVFGFALLAMSRAYALGDSWVLAGLVLFVGVALLAEGVCGRPSAGSGCRRCGGPSDRVAPGTGSMEGTRR